jgi:hypothetical protein
MRAPVWSAPVWDDFAALVEWHEGRCAVCGRSEGLSGLCWFMLQYDHEHLSGEDRRAGRLRGLLCPSCNNRERYGGGPRDRRALLDLGARLRLSAGERLLAAWVQPTGAETRPVAGSERTHSTAGMV